MKGNDGALLRSLAGFLVLALPAAGEPRRFDQIPDLTQTEVKGDAHGDGQQYCGPVAVSNSLSWLALQRRGGRDAPVDQHDQQLEMVRKLASPGYMNTSLEDGSGTSDILRGVDRLARELFDGYASLSYQGWRKHPRSFSTGIEEPQLRWILDGVGDASAAWLNIGWYRYEAAKDEYHRFGGHWVTLVGFENNRLVIHDPSPRAGLAFANDFVAFRRLNTGRLTGSKAGLPRSARGFLVLTDGLHQKRGADAAILDGVVVLHLDP